MWAGDETVAGICYFVPPIFMDANQTKPRVTNSFTLEPFTIDVFENSTPDVDEHRYLIGISMADEKGILRHTFAVCSCHAREFGQLLERAADCAERECESVNL